MKQHKLTTKIFIPESIQTVFGFFSEASNLERITPAHLKFQIESSGPLELKAGAVIDYKLRLHGLPMHWRSVIPVWHPPHEFVDEQVKGPYRSWIHHHGFEADGSGGTVITDTVRYALPLAPFGELVHPFIRRQLTAIFLYRQKAVREILSPGSVADPEQEAPVFG